MRDQVIGRASNFVPRVRHFRLLNIPSCTSGVNNGIILKPASQAFEAAAQRALRENERLEEQVADLQRQVSCYEQQRQQQLERGSSSADVGGILDTTSQAKDPSQRRPTDSLGHACNANISGAQEVDVTHEMDVLRYRVKDLEEEVTARLNQSKAVAQMRRLLREKNGMVSELRQRLGKYEPDALRAHGGDGGDAELECC